MPASKLVAFFMIGQTLGHYRIAEKIGAGSPRIYCSWQWVRVDFSWVEAWHCPHKAETHSHLPLWIFLKGCWREKQMDAARISGSHPCDDRLDGGSGC